MMEMQVNSDESANATFFTTCYFMLSTLLSLDLILYLTKISSEISSEMFNNSTVKNFIANSLIPAPPVLVPDFKDSSTQKSKITLTSSNYCASFFTFCENTDVNFEQIFSFIYQTHHCHFTIYNNFVTSVCKS